jgi:hypothetical protein
MAKPPEDPKKDEKFKKVVERMLKTPPKPHKPPKRKRKEKEPTPNKTT